jgi:hypothetical protein
VRHAVAEIDHHGNATLVFTPGRYVLDKRGQLTAAIVQGLPVDPVEDLADTLSDEVAAWLAGQDRPSIDTTSTGMDTGPVATLDRSGDQQKSTPDRQRIGGRVGRSIEQLRSELRAKLRAKPDSIDPTSAESIRKALRCSPTRARQLRDELRNAD